MSVIAVIYYHSNAQETKPQWHIYSTTINVYGSWVLDQPQVSYTALMILAELSHMTVLSWLWLI